MVAVVPILRISEVDRALAWWERLGFSEEWRHRFEPGLPVFVGLHAGGQRVYLSQHEGDAPGPALVYLWVVDVDAVAADLGVEVQELPWARECEVVDPDGNRVRIATAQAV